MILITGGCSFSDCTYIKKENSTWPIYLSENINLEKHYATGLDSIGNSLISKKVLYTCEQLLKITNSENLLVGIMWSNPNRETIYINGKIPRKAIPQTKLSNDDLGSWLILNARHNNMIAKNYFVNLHDEVWGYIKTLEIILHTQWYLERKNIKYFMMPYENYVFNEKLYENTNVKWLYDQIDFSKFITMTGCYEWCRDNTNFPFREHEENLAIKHPTSDHHKSFTEKVIIPWLENNQYINGAQRED